MTGGLFGGDGGEAPEAAHTSISSVALEYACWFRARLEQAHPRIRTPTEPAFQKWIDASRLMLTRDDRTVDDLYGMGNWLFASESEGASFWRSVILSLPKLRQQFDKLNACRRYELERNRRRPSGRTGVMDAAQALFARHRQQ